MTYARKSLISLQDTPYYHVVARCVRRAWLWGFDHYAGRDYSHRKHWVIERLSSLCSIFAIEVCAYAVMSNHYHLVLHVDRATAREWSKQEVVARWKRLFNAPPLVESYLAGAGEEVERAAAEILIERWRERLHDISWFMKCLNEHLARRANAEDECKGKFWEGRFRSQALLDEVGLLMAMAYVDLNPVRAGIATTPEESEFTSVYQRIRELRQPAAKPGTLRIQLRRFVEEGQKFTTVIPCTLESYVSLVDWTGRILRDDKPGAIDSQAPPIMQRLKVDAQAWTTAMRPSGNVFGRAMGRLSRLRLHAKTLGQSWIRGLNHAASLFG